MANATKSPAELNAEANAILATAGLTKGGAEAKAPKGEKVKANKEAKKPAEKGKAPKETAAERKAREEHEAAQGNRGTPTAELLKPKSKPKKGTTEVGNAENGATRATWHGYSVTSVLRALGHKGWNVARCKAFLSAAGIPLRENCVKCQCGSGRRFRSAGKGETPTYGPLAPLTKEQFAEAAKLAPEAAE